ncbi:glycoside hydrolase family 127 protein [Sphingomonas psychrotolerans]|uniref:Glycoside hydrolase family 127 protein n=1 Tax=Sphingomonas psychrotolerans TaxID=1327635 RepID=A0ABU3N1Z6_9SPHN|nr:glycoside hydrolase family 127 protein [Sphingomonas psychrotolerans]MDT8758560.1 glycoside hydrolase family 127 protein [Sphingomonas psychrotolerans]
MLTRRLFLGSASALALVGPAVARVGIDEKPIRARPLPLSAVRLRPSAFLDAVEINRRYLLSLSPERLLHNFYASAGLPTKGPTYGGWEARGIAGHTLGHYLSALSLLYAQTGDAAVRDRLRHTVAEMARIQAAQGDGYVGGTTVERNGKVVDGKIVFEEIRKGDIRTSGFDINGGWVPLYTWHKVHAGLIEAVRLGDVPEAMPVMLGMAGYLGTILEGLDDAQMQKLLAAEHGGLNDSYAETYALTGNPRWRRLAERIYHRKVLAPLAAGKDDLPGLHANTQIPKLIGLARLYELTGEQRHADAARFFHQTVMQHHSYVIGGNSEREHFGPPDQISTRITERTCEACNSYNMLKLTRHLYGWQPEASLFDIYERIHLNHLLAHQHPETGMFVYFMPLSAGARRTYSTPEDSFWCCVGSGMETHAKHGDSIYWEDGAALYVNLFIPSAAEWKARGLRLELDTEYPFDERVTLRVTKAPRATTAITLRLPGWCDAPALALNGKPQPLDESGGYARLERRWRAGDRVELTLPMRVRTEPTPDDPRMLAFLSGPLVLAADLGPAEAPFDGPAPVLVSGNPVAALAPVAAAAHRFRLADARPKALTLEPFFGQYDRRTAVYFPRFTEAQWKAEAAAYGAAQREKAALDARTVDVLHLGEMQPERDHDYRANHSDLFSWGGRSARQLPWGTGNYMEFTLAVRPGPMLLRALYWGEEVNKNFDVSAEGVRIANERRAMPAEKRFVSIDYPIPEALTRGKDKVVVRFETKGTDAFVYEARTLAK